MLALFACASSLLIVPASAQAVYGSIFGTVTDKSGAVIPDATITVTDVAKGTVVTVNSNDIRRLQRPPPYSRRLQPQSCSQGLQDFRDQGHLRCLADTAPRIDPTLDVGSDTGTTVQVNAETQPQLKTDRADVATVFDQQQVANLPVGDQNFTNLQIAWFPAPRSWAGPTRPSKTRRPRSRSW